MNTTDSLIDRLRFGTAASLLATLGMFGTSAVVAQDQSDDEEDEALEEVVITGTRLTKSNLSSAVPMIQIGAQEIDNRGVARVEDIVNILPNVFVAQTSEVANGASGTSNLNLRGLGAVRTLVLLDGKRMPFGSPFSAAPNTDFVPSQLVERVDVLTAGASAVYGSDAVGGVVNFITKRDFEGIELDAQFGINQNPNDNAFMADVLQRSGIADPGANWGGEDYFITGVFGANLEDGRGNVTAFFSYQQQAQIIGADRDTGACTLGGSTTIRCIGSSNFRRFNQASGFRAANPDAFGGALFQDDDGTLIPLDTSQVAQTYNFGERNFYQRPIERFNMNASAYYEVTEGIEAYMDFGFMNNITTAQIAESASFNRAFQTNCDNPLLQTGQGVDPNTGLPFNFGDRIGIGSGTAASPFFSCNALLADGDPTNDGTEVAFINSHRNVEGGPRQSTFDNSQWRVVGGFRGDISDDFSFDVFVQHSGTRGSRTSQNDLNFNRVQQSLFIVDDGNGNAVCRDTSGGCVPWNIFDRTDSGETLVTRQQTDFIQGTGIVIGETSQLVVGGTVEGDLTPYGFKLPWAENGLTGLVGFEYREDSLVRVPDDISQIAGGQGLTGTGGATLPINGDINVWEAFAEAELPLVQDKPLVKELGIRGGFRYSDYSTEGPDLTGETITNAFEAETWYISASWIPVDDIRFRANFSRAIRAPNVFNLYTGINTGLVDLTTGENGLFDPCAADPINGIAPRASQEACARTGLSAAQYNAGVEDNPAGQFNLITGGNPELTAETADNLTLGLIFTPSFVPGLTVSVDYFDIEVSNAIGSVPAQASLDNCIAGGQGSEVFCNLIQRDIFGTLWLSNDAPGGGLAGISQQSANISTLQTNGVDVNVQYTIDTDDLGQFSIDYAATFLGALDTIPFEGDDPIECAGVYAGQCGLPNPEYRHRFLANWNTPWDLTVALTWRFIGETTLFGLDEAAAANREEQLNDFMEARNYFDLAFNYRVNDNYSVRLGINNIFANDPPVSTNVGTGTGNNNTYPGLFDTSRFMFIGVNARF